MVKTHDFPSGFPRWCERSSTNAKKAAFTLDVSLEVDADVEEKPSSCVNLCAQKRVYKTATAGLCETKVQADLAAAIPGCP